MKHIKRNSLTLYPISKVLVKVCCYALYFQIKFFKFHIFNLHERNKILFSAFIKKRNCFTHSICSTSSTTSMHEHISIGRGIKLDDEINVGYVNTSSSHICCE
ncbi:hypothetical protein SCY_1746 [Saccharomyces cerevisiae YJM789]|uniref:Uncharacterized protein n=1 Tax=Saccharomyces cerevisiae (strain YJM789) TaxID=307796 RepID=A7A236_YEAS7|nr:hypothetical protein SCY_1746 [Saccharomyces cerevisiae YJM789]